MTALIAVALVALFLVGLLAAFGVFAVAGHLQAIALAIQAQNRHRGIPATPAPPAPTPPVPGGLRPSTGKPPPPENPSNFTR